MKLARTATLFSGGGTLEAGLVGLTQPVFAVEYDPQIAAHYRSVWGPHVVAASVSDVDYRAVATAIAPVDYLHASPVCKSFSAAKLESGERCEDLAMAEATVAALVAFRPKVFTVENVPDYVRSRSFATIVNALERLGYSFDARVFDASEYGAATRRKRLLVRAVSSGSVPPPPAPTGGADWYEAVADLIPSMRDSTLPKWSTERMARKGVTLADFRRPALIGGGSAGAGVVPFAEAGGPAFTIKATPNELHRVVLPGGVVKALSPRALARLSGLPDAYPLPDKSALAITIVGNGIPVPLTRTVIGALLRSRARSFHGREAT